MSCFHQKRKRKGASIRLRGAQRFLSTAKQGDNALSSVRPSICPCVDLFVCALPLGSHYQSKVIDRLCVCNQSACAVNRAEAVDRLLMVHGNGGGQNFNAQL